MPEFRRLLHEGDRCLIGTVVSLPSPEVVEMAAQAGFDWLFVDCEHGMAGSERLQSMLQAAGRCPCLVRTPSADPALIAKVLDCGAAGVIVPQVDDAEQARAIVRAAKYPPDGKRGIGVARAQGYGVALAGYLSGANEATVVVVQAEHPDAVARIEQIAAVPGVDAVLVGPYDLSAAMGRPGEVHDAEVRAAITKVLGACLAAGIAPASFAATPDAASALRDQGFRALAVGTDTLLLTEAMSTVVRALST